MNYDRVMGPRRSGDLWATHRGPSTFTRDFAAYSVMMMQGPERPEVNGGGKIIMPPSALESLSRLNISYPMLFKIENKGLFN